MQLEIFTESHAGIVTGAYVALNALCLLLLDHWICGASLKYRNSVTGRVIICFLFIAVSSFPVIAVFMREGIYKYYIERSSYIWLGFLMYFGAIILIMTVLAFVVSLFTPSRGAGDPGSASRVISGIMLIAMIGASVGINIYGMEHARDTVVTRYDVKIDKAVKSRDVLRCALISDLHLSYNSDLGQIRQMVEKVNREKPDVVFVTGDMFSSSYSSVREPDKYIKALKGIKAKEGVYWVYGNHDVEEPLFCGFSLDAPENAKRTKRIKKFLKKAGFRILDDKCTAICKGEVQLAGRADEYKPVEKAEKRKTPDELLEDIYPKKPVIVLSHEPDDFGALAAEGADILFSGHTHDGQIFPGNLIISMFHDVSYGLAERNGMKVIVTSGVGCYGPPIRIMTNSEIVITDIHFSN